jgi:ribokinase
MKKRIFVVGSLNIDFSIQSSRFPHIGETIVGQGFSIDTGGKGANQAVACARAGVVITMIGAVGNDVFGPKLIDTLKNEGIDIAFIDIKETTTGCAIINVAQGHNKIVIDHGANFAIEERQIALGLEHANQGDILITQFEIPRPIIAFALKLAKSKGMTTIVNPAPACYSIGEMHEDIDFIIPNETEYEYLLTREKSNLLSIKHLIITLGAEGVNYIYNGVSKTISGLKVAAIDTTAAGDTFIGYFAAMMANDCDIITSLEIANYAASISVTRRGAMTSIPYLKEVKAV